MEEKAKLFMNNHTEWKNTKLSQFLKCLLIAFIANVTMEVANPTFHKKIIFVYDLVRRSC